MTTYDAWKARNRADEELGPEPEDELEPEPEHIGTSHGEFSVVQFFDDGAHEYVRRNVSAEEAVRSALHYSRSVAARFGITCRVIITDGLDLTVFEWVYGRGIVFPDDLREDLAKTGILRPRG